MVDELGGSKRPSKPPRKMAGVPGEAEGDLSAAALLAARAAAATNWGLGPVSRMLPTLRTLGQPLYLMP